MGYGSSHPSRLRSPQRPSPVALTVLLALVLATSPACAQSPPSDSPFSDAALFPSGPSAAERSFQPLLAEAASWTDLAIFRALVTTLVGAGKLPPPPTDFTPFVVFAPTNEAFLKYLLNVPAVPAPVFNDSATVASLLARVVAAVSTSPDAPLVAALARVVAYHVVVGLNSEPALAANGSVSTLPGFPNPPLNTSAVPAVVDALGGTSTRYGRSLRINGNGLLVTVDAVLQPVNLTDALQAFLFPSPAPAPAPTVSSLPGIPRTLQPFRSPSFPVGGPSPPGVLPPAPFAYPYLSYPAFLAARADLRIFSALAAALPDLEAALASFDRTVHPLLPTDAAFLALLRAVPVPAYARLADLYTADPFDDALRAQVVRLLAAIVPALPGQPSPLNVVQYHVLASPDGLGNRVGPQATLLGNNTLSIAAFGGRFFVADSDVSRQDPRVVVTFATRTGYVSVIDAVLLPLNLVAAIEGLVESGATENLPQPVLPSAAPSPDPSTVPSVPREPAPGPGAPNLPEDGSGGEAAGPVDDVLDGGSVEPDPDASPESTAGATEIGATTVPPTGATTAPTTGGATTSPAPASSDDDDDGVCFPADAKLHRADGSRVAMSDVQPGDVVQTHPFAASASSRVFLFSHRTPAAAARNVRVVRLETANGHVVRATRGHYVYVAGRLRAFARVRVGDKLLTVDGESAVVNVRYDTAHGLYAPHAVGSGDLVVDGVWVSAYSTAVRPAVAHALLAPLRFAADRLGWVEPIGSALYNGADHLLKFIPRGAEVH